MATIHDQRAFDLAVSAAQNRHQNDIVAAQSAYECACRQTMARWKERLDAAKERFEAVKNDPHEAFAVIRREYHEASARSPDFEAARQQLGRDVEAATVALNEALAAARQKLLAAPASDNLRPIRAAE